jgi:drug/metabolite transporter (DMT)-like permease
VTLKIFVGVVAMITCMTVSTIMLKLGAGKAVDNGWLMSLINIKIFSGLTLLLFALIIYCWLLAKLPLNVAQSLSASQFIFVILASSVVLSEPIPPIRWLGIAMIAAGVAIVGFSSISNGQ